MNKKKLQESDVRAKFIDPALKKAGWDEETQVRREVPFTDGQINVRGKTSARGKSKFADYVLSYKPDLPIAIIEAKNSKESMGAGMQQALGYAESLNIPFVFSSNGDGFVFHDRTGRGDPREVNLSLDAFPSPAELWKRYKTWKGLDNEAEELVLQDYHSGAKTPRYYQVNAVNAVVEAIARGQERILLVMATGTGKTHTAFQIIWRLWKARRKKRFLFLADRNVLVDQTMANDFRPFTGAMTRLSTRHGAIERQDDGTVIVDTSCEIYLGLYQAITGPDESQQVFRQISPDFFDLIIIDECHRGSAADDAAWREILEYFSSATQIGMTATPKETEYASNIAYFGEPVFSYSLKQGIADGFLAPYKVVRVHIDVDVEGYRPPPGKLDRDGQEVEARDYGIKDFDRTLVIDDRTQLAARKVTQFLEESGDPYQKTIIFCVDQEHADRMRQALVNENADLVSKDDRYVMRITSDDQEGQAQLGNFSDPEEKCPVLVTTSRLLSTGVDVPTCRLIVLDRDVGSMTEFKQIIGRGTRIHEDSRKYYFTLIDFRGATRHFADPDFDGEPVQIYEPGENDPMDPPDASPGDEDGGDGETITDEPETPPDGPRKKIYIDGVPVEIIAERVRYLDQNGRLITESLRDFTRKSLQRRFASLDDFLNCWDAAERKHAVIEELEKEGVPLDSLIDVHEYLKDLDPFDLICHIAFDAMPRTRRQRAENVKERNIFGKYGDKARAVLRALLTKYGDGDIQDLNNPDILKVAPLSELGAPLELMRAFGDIGEFKKAIRDLQSELYREAA